MLLILPLRPSLVGGLSLKGEGSLLPLLWHPRWHTCSGVLEWWALETLKISCINSKCGASCKLIAHFLSNWNSFSFLRVPPPDCVQENRPHRRAGSHGQCILHVSKIGLFSQQRLLLVDTQSSKAVWHFQKVTSTKYSCRPRREDSCLSSVPGCTGWHFSPLVLTLAQSKPLTLCSLISLLSRWSAKMRKINYFDINDNVHNACFSRKNFLLHWK